MDASQMDPRAAEVQAYLAREGCVVQNFSQPTPTSATAAEAVGCTVAEIAKSVLVKVGGRPVLVVTCGDTRVKSGRLKQVCGLTGKVTLPEPGEVVRCTGYPPGAVSPFLLPSELPVLLDSSLQRFETVYPAAGTASSAVAVSFVRLRELCGAPVVDVCDIQDIQD